MMKILNIGMNHETAPIELRECLATEPGNNNTALSLMRNSEHLKEGFFLSTCNRIEALCTTDKLEDAKKTILSLMAEIGGRPEKDFLPNIYFFEDNDAVKHIFRVASSLDSMIVGEPQILGQIKDAYYNATKEKTSGVIINRLMHKAFHVAKRVRTETGISNAAVSISYAAVELAKKIFFELTGKKVFLIGAGEMAELAAKHLVRQGASDITVANRTFERAVKVSESFNGKPVDFKEIPSTLIEADIVITSTASTEYVINNKEIKGLMKKRRNRPLFFIDIAVPRDIDPKVNQIGNVYLYDIDDLKNVIEVNKTQRQQEAVKAERIIQEESIKFEKWIKTLDVVPTIVALKEKAEEIRQAEVQKSFSNMGNMSDEQIKTIELLTVSIAEKLINDPIVILKRKADRSVRDRYIDMTRRLFNLDENGNGE